MPSNVFPARFRMIDDYWPEGLAFSPDSIMFAIAYTEDKVKLYDVESVEKQVGIYSFSENLIQSSIPVIGA